MLGRDFIVRSCANAEFMIPAGKRTKLPVVQVFLEKKNIFLINLIKKNLIDWKLCSR